MQNIWSLSVYLNYQYNFFFFFFFFCNIYKIKSTTINNGINAIKEVRKLFNELISNLSDEETKRIRKKLHTIEAVYSVLKEKEQKGSLTSRQKNMLWNDERYLKNFSKHLKN